MSLGAERPSERAGERNQNAKERERQLLEIGGRLLIHLKAERGKCWTSFIH